MLQLLLFLLPLGLDTLGVSISLGMKAARGDRSARAGLLPAWLRSALLFALAEMTMPLVGLAIGYAASLLVSEIMRFVGPLILIGIGLWELVEEAREVMEKRRKQKTTLSHLPSSVPQVQPSSPTPPVQSLPTSNWARQLLLALSISLDELAVGFSLGTVTARLASGKAISPFIVCALIGLQGFLMTLLGLILGGLLRTSVRPLKQWSEWLSAFLLIGLGVWLLVLGD